MCQNIFLWMDSSFFFTGIFHHDKEGIKYYSKLLEPLLYDSDGGSATWVGGGGQKRALNFLIFIRFWITGKCLF